MHYQNRKVAIGLQTSGCFLSSELSDYRSQTSDKARNGAVDVLAHNVDEGSYDSNVEEDT